MQAKLNNFLIKQFICNTVAPLKIKTSRGTNINYNTRYPVSGAGDGLEQVVGELLWNEGAQIYGQRSGA